MQTQLLQAMQAVLQATQACAMGCGSLSQPARLHAGPPQGTPAWLLPVLGMLCTLRRLTCCAASCFSDAVRSVA